MKYLGSVSSWFLVVLFAMTVVTLLYGESDQKRNPAKAISSQNSQRIERVTAHTARALIGEHVQGSTGDTLGRVNDIVINPRTGRILFVVLTSGGFAGVGARLHPIPPGALYLAWAKRGILALDIGPKRWKSAPLMNKEKLANLENATVAQKIYSFYHQPSSSLAKGDLHPGDPAAHLMLATELMGESVIHPENGEVGRVSDLSVDLKNPVARAIVVPIGERNSVAIPLDQFESSAARNTLFLNADIRSFQRLHTVKDTPIVQGKMASKDQTHL